MKMHHVVKNAVMAAVISAILATTAFADLRIKEGLLKVAPAGVYQAAKGSGLADTLAKVAQRSGISFKISTDLSKDIVQQTIAADNWNDAIKSLLAGYNYSTITENDQLKTVIIIGRNTTAGIPITNHASASSIDDVIVIEANLKPLPPKYKGFPVGSVTGIDLPVNSMMKVDDQSSIALDLPMGQFNVMHDHTVNEADGSKTWMGYLQDEGEGYRVYVSQGAAGTMGTITTPDGSYNIESSNNGIYLVDTTKLKHTGFDGDQIEPSDAMLNQIAMNALTQDATQAQIDQLQAAVDNAKKTLDAANADVTKYTDLLAQYTKQLNAATSTASTLVSTTTAKDNASKALATATAAKNKAATVLATASTARDKAVATLSAATTAKNTAEATYDTKNSTVSAAKTALDKALTVKTTAQSVMNENLTVKTAANTKLQADKSVKTAADAALTLANSAKTKAQAAVTTANTGVSKAQSALNAAQTALSSASSKLSAAKTASAVNTANAAVAKANTGVSDAQSKYDAALAAQNTANAALATATENYGVAAGKAQEANTVYQASLNAYNAAASAYTAALSTYNSSVSSATSANSAYTSAVNALSAAQIALTKANAALTTATTAHGNAVATYNAATAAVASANTTFDNATSAYATANANYSAALAAKNSLSTLQASVSATKALLDQKTAVAKTAKQAYDQAVIALNNAKSGGVDSGNNAGGGTTSTGPVVDIMILYTTVNQTADYAKQRIALLTTASNQAYKDSGINMTLRVVYTEPTAYNDVVSNGQALDDLARDQKEFSGVSAKRSQYGADLVFLFRPLYAQTHGSCGTTYLEFANGNPANKWLGYGTIGDGSSKDAMKGYYCAINTYTHEIGHSLGLVHDREFSDASGVFYYSYAWGNQGSFGTIMSYKQPVIMYFSSPALATQCKGQPCGYSETDSARSSDQAKSINYTAPLIANFMPTTVATPILK